MKINGKVHKYGNDVNTDVIIPGQYLNLTTAEALAPHCMEDIDKSFAKKVQPGDIIVGENNFGCGSSREHAPLAIKGSGVGCVIAKNFARIFFRSAINIGLPILESEEAVDGTTNEDALEVDLITGEIKNLTKKINFKAKPYPDFLMKLIRDGGLVANTRKRIGIIK